VLGWDAAREEREVAFYVKRVAAERASQEQPDDASADRIRLEAPDVNGADHAGDRPTTAR
jgi:glycerol-3-phosphate dehydrogenase